MSDRLKGLKEDLAEKRSALVTLNKKFENSDSAASEEEMEGFRSLAKEIDDLKSKVEFEEERNNIAKANAQEQAQTQSAEHRAASMAAGSGTTDGETKEARKVENKVEWGKVAESLQRGRALSGAAKEIHQLAEEKDGRSYDGIAIPGFLLDPEKRAVVDQANSALTPTDVSSQYVEAIRESAIYSQVGATVYNNLQGPDFLIPVAGKITAAHASAENSAAADGGAQFSNPKLQAQRITTYADLSNKISLQNGDIAMRAVMNEIGLAVGETINDAMFPTSSLSNAPTSIAATSSVGTFTEAGTYAAPSNTVTGSIYADFVAALVTLTKADALKGSLAFVANPELMTDLIKAASIMGVRPAIANESIGNTGQTILGRPLFFTNSATADAGTSGDFIFGNFKKVHVGFFDSLNIIRDNLTQAGKDVTRLVAHRYYDFKLVQGAAFVKGTSLSA